METPLESTQVESEPKLSPGQSRLALALANGESTKGIFQGKAEYNAIGDIRAKFSAAAERQGLTADRLALELVRKLTVTKTKLFAHEGVITDVAELEDTGAQLTAIEIAGRFLGLGRDQNVGTIVNGNVLVAWNGTSPEWMPHPDNNPSGVDTVTIPVREPPRPRSRSEGTGSGPGRSTHIRSTKKGKLKDRIK